MFWPHGNLLFGECGLNLVDSGTLLLGFGFGGTLVHVEFWLDNTLSHFKKRMYGRTLLTCTVKIDIFFRESDHFRKGFETFSRGDMKNPLYRDFKPSIEGFQTFSKKII